MAPSSSRGLTNGPFPGLAAVLGAAVGALVLTGCGEAERGQTASKSAAEPAGVESAVEAAREAIALALPGDLDRIAQLCTLTIEGADRLGQLEVRATDARRDMTIRIPAGLQLTLTAKPDDAGQQMAVTRATMLEVTRGQGSQTLAAVWLDVEGWGVLKGRRFEPANQLADARLLKLWSQAQQESAGDWLDLQILTWVMTQDIGIAELQSRRVVVQTGMQSMFGAPGTEAAVYSYASVRRLEEQFNAMGLDPGQHRLFGENQQALADELAKVTPVDWSEKPTWGYSGNLFGRLGRYHYKGETQVFELLMSYAAKHQDPFTRVQAVAMIDELGGLPIDSANALERAIQEEDRIVRLAYLRTLARQGDLRFEPMQLSYADDAALHAISSPADMRGYLQKRSGRSVNGEESLLTFWERSIGWQAMQDKYGDVAAVRAAATRIKAQEEQLIIGLVQQVLDARQDKPQKLMQELARRFPAQRQTHAAFEKLLGHADAKVREAVIYRSLPLLKAYMGVPYGRFESMAKNDPSPQVVAMLLQPTITGQDRFRYEQLAQAATHNSNPQARANGVRALIDFAGSVDRLAQLAVSDADASVRRAAIEALFNRKADQALPAAKQLLQSSEPAAIPAAQTALAKLAFWADPTAAFALVAEAAVSSPLAAVREEAIERLPQFVKHQQPVIATLNQAQQGNQSEPAALAIVAAARLVLIEMRNRKISDDSMQLAAETLLGEAARNQWPAVQLRAVECMGWEKVTSQLDAVEHLVRHADERGLASKAFWLLKEHDAKRAAAALASWLESHDARTRGEAVTLLLKHFADDPQTRTLLEPYRSDAVLGQRIEAYLGTRNQ